MRSSTYYRSFIFTSNRVFTAFIYTEQERSRGRLCYLTTLLITKAKSSKFFCLPFCCCKATKDIIIGCLDNSDSPSFFITTSIEILNFPPISHCIIYPLEPSLRILVSNKFHNHLPMGGGPKGLWSPEKRFRVIYQSRRRWNRMRNRYMRNWLTFGFLNFWLLILGLLRSRDWARISLFFNGILKLCLRFLELQRKLFKLSFALLEVLSQGGD